MKIIDSTPVIADAWKPVLDAQTVALEAVDSMYRDRFDAIASMAKTATEQADAERTLRDLRAEHFAAREPLSKALAETRMRAERPNLIIQLEPGEQTPFGLSTSHGLPPAKG